MKINWKKQALEFLKNHGWKRDEEVGCWFHPLFPLGEDLSTEKLVLDFINKFYNGAWLAYISLVKYAERLSEEEKEKIRPVQLGDIKFDDLIEEEICARCKREPAVQSNLCGACLDELHHS